MQYNALVVIFHQQVAYSLHQTLISLTALIRFNSNFQILP